MIDYLNIPTIALINTPISKKLFADKAPLSAAEKRMLREDVESIAMKGLLQTRTIGLPSYSDDEYLYDQIIVSEVRIKSLSKASAIATMIQRAFPVPMFLILSHDNQYSINWCVKRINQADRSKRVMEEQQITRFFAIDDRDIIARSWLHSLDITKLQCPTLKDMFDELCGRLIMLTVSDEAEVFIEANAYKVEQFRAVLKELADNREEQKKVSAKIKAETQFNAQLKLSSKLKTLQFEEKRIKEKLK
ncbi:DUF4391 domain-containing protein [Bacteroides sp.]|uniref:DUF4391 domain-containing protein n=1 Tax=Bacteroides sp. TaxID=29523 RepID=UPI002634C900|nr:DUF4391 domain-containing protein [Bacteroides sp.]MDD3038126.1 DUF4391 domain-containing protein [Bacteroides sp.]